MNLSIELHDRARALMQSLEAALNEPTSRGIGTANPTIYDTAWVAMVSRVLDGRRTFVFPESFSYIYEAQASDGKWDGDGSLIDAIVNTLACLLALKVHEASDGRDIASRARAAQQYLVGALRQWDVMETERVAYEMIVTSLLKQLEGYGIMFDFPHKDLLYTMYSTKLSKLDWEAIYARNSSLLHCMEAFVGTADFDRMPHLLRDGNFMATPSTTAAYLIHATKWDERAEDYLRHVIKVYAPHGRGVVPNLWPMTFFEIVWSLSSLYDTNFDFSQMDPGCLDRIACTLREYLVRGKGVVGFVPGTTHDADMSSKSLMLLHALNRPYSHDAFVAEFEAPTYFRCYSFERNASVTVNSNCLMSLLVAPDVDVYCSQIIKIAGFVADVWWTSEGPVKDKWNVSQWYSSMLSSQALLRMLHIHGKGHLKDTPQDLLSKIAIALFTMMSRILHAQKADGSWGCPEETAYALITLANVVSLPLCAPIVDHVCSVIDAAKTFLLPSLHGRPQATPADRLWIDKVTYSVESFRDAYLISALNISIPRYDPASITALPPISATRVEELARFFGKLPTFKDVPMWRMLTWGIESSLFVPELNRVPSLTFASTEKAITGSWFEYLPFMIIAPISLEKAVVSPQGILDILVVIRALYHTDDYLDMTLNKETAEELLDLREKILALFSNPNSFSSPHSVPEGILPRHIDVIERFAYSLLSHPRVQLASDRDKALLRSEIEHYFLSGLAQCQENLVLRARGVENPHVGTSHYRWIHNIGVDNIAGFIGLSFVLCLVGHNVNAERGQRVSVDVFPTPMLKYLFNDCAMHMSAYSRLCNDLHSIPRDQREINLNSTFFPEFSGPRSGTDDNTRIVTLREVVEFERKCANDGFEELCHRLTPFVGSQRARNTVNFIRILYVHTELYDELVEATSSDISNYAVESTSS